MQPRQTSALRIFCRAWIAAWLSYFAWEALAYRGFFGKLAEFQITHMGGYAPLLTFFILVGVTACPAWLLLRRIRLKELVAAELGEADAYRLEGIRSLRTVMRGFAVATSIGAVAFVLYATFMLPGPGGRIQTIAASEANAVPIVDGPARLVGGEVGAVVLFGQSWFLGGDRMAFAPYRATAKNPDAATLFVQLPVLDNEKPPSFQQQTSWSGIIVEGGLPGTVRTLLNSAGVGISSPYFTLYASNYDLRIWYWLQSIQWALVTLFLLASTWLLSRQAKRLEQSLNLVGPRLARS